MTIGVSLRLPERLAKDLDKLAIRLERPKSYLIRKAVETYLEEYVDSQIALDRLRDEDDAIISGSELRKRLGL